MAYDAARNRVVLFGGLTREGATQFEVLGGSWAFDGEHWSELDSPLSPRKRSAAVMAPFPPKKAAILVGGSDGFGVFSDTWALVYRDLASCGNGYLDPGEGCDGGDLRSFSRRQQCETRA